MLNRVIIRLLQRVFALKKRRRVYPPLSKATGGLLPGVDLTRFSDYQEMEDLGYVERMKRFK